MDDDLSLAYANAAFIPDAGSYPPKWMAEAQAFRLRLGDRATLGLAYGSAPRQRFDLFLPEARAVGLMVFIHGGYWLESDRSDWSHLAQGAMARGWAVAMPGYTLAPEARIRQIADEVELAIAAAARRVPGPIVITGHSAGGHLTARMACADRTPDWANRLARVVPISPVADLRPLLRTSMNAQLHLDREEAECESPALLARRGDVGCTIWVGGQERPAFLWQARALSEHWACPWHVEPPRHHFDVIEDLTDPESALMQVLVD